MLYYLMNVQMVLVVSLVNLLKNENNDSFFRLYPSKTRIFLYIIVGVVVFIGIIIIIIITITIMLVESNKLLYLFKH